MTRTPFLLSALLFVAQVHAAGLPDTGHTLCSDGTASVVVCTSGNAGNAATYRRQDGRFGRDPKAVAGTLAKTGAGAAGFDYTKVANNGTDLAAGTALGTAATAWACTRDNITGLTWEVKTATATDLRYSDHRYSWYSTNGSTNGGNSGNDNGGSCNATLPGNLCNTQAFITAVNAAALCTYSDWRLPNLRELSTLVHFGASSPSIDTTYFPNTPVSNYRSATSNVGNTSQAWSVYFFEGTTLVNSKAGGDSLRLVRGGQL